MTWNVWLKPERAAWFQFFFYDLLVYLWNSSRKQRVIWKFMDPVAKKYIMDQSINSHLARSSMNYLLYYSRQSNIILLQCDGNAYWYWYWTGSCPIYDILPAFKVQYSYTYVMLYLKSMKMTDRIAWI